MLINFELKCYNYKNESYLIRLNNNSNIVIHLMFIALNMVKQKQ